MSKIPVAKAEAASEIQFQRTLKKLESLYEGDDAVLQIVSVGAKAIPALRELLFKREPSGFYQRRTRAVDALLRLRAYDVLFEFLDIPRDITDPIERMGEDAVINAAAKALAQQGGADVLGLLLRLGRRLCLTGVIVALGTFQDPRMIPVLIGALSEDVSRLSAEAALKRLGIAALPALAMAANRPNGHLEQESESQLRKRRSALCVLDEIGVPRPIWRKLRTLMREPDQCIALTACEICLKSGTKLDRRDAVVRLLRLSADADWATRDEVERCLVAHISREGSLLPGAAQLVALMAESEPLSTLIRRLLRRVNGLVGA